MLFRGRGVVSSLIRWQTRSAYSHAALLDVEGRVIEAKEGRGVIRRPAEWVYAEAAESGVEIEAYGVRGATGIVWWEALEFAASQLGVGYDYLAIARFISRRKHRNRNRWFCSELVFASLAYGGIRLLERIDDSEVSPGLLAISPLMEPKRI